MKLGLITENELLCLESTQQILAGLWQLVRNCRVHFSVNKSLFVRYSHDHAATCELAAVSPSAGLARVGSHLPRGNEGDAASHLEPITPHGQVNFHTEKLECWTCWVTLRMRNWVLATTRIGLDTFIHTKTNWRDFFPALLYIWCCSSIYLSAQYHCKWCLLLGINLLASFNFRKIHLNSFWSLSETVGASNKDNIAELWQLLQLFTSPTRDFWGHFLTLKATEVTDRRVKLWEKQTNKPGMGRGVACVRGTAQENRAQCKPCATGTSESLDNATQYWNTRWDICKIQPKCHFFMSF